MSDYEPHEMTIRGEIQKYQVVPDAGVETQAEEFRNLHSSFGYVSSDQYAARFWQNTTDGAYRNHSIFQELAATNVRTYLLIPHVRVKE